MDTLTFQKNGPHKLKNEVKLLFTPSVVLFQFLDLIRLLKSYQPNLVRSPWYSTTYPLTDHTHRDSKPLIPFTRAERYRHRSSRAGQPLRSGIHAPFSILPFRHDLFRYNLCLVVKGNENMSEQTNPFPQSANPRPGVRPVEQDYD